MQPYDLQPGMMGKLQRIMRLFQLIALLIPHR